MGNEQRVVPESLERQANEMDDGQAWHNPAAEAVVPPDALPSSSAAVANLNANAQSLLEFQNWAEAENKRIAEMLKIAAGEYRRVDEQYGQALDNPERRAAVEAIAVPAPSTPPAPVPTPVGAQQSLEANGYSDVYQTQADLTSPDDGASLKTAMLQWALASKRTADKVPSPPPGDWEGEAADAAFARMTEFAGHLRQLSTAWEDLGEAAAKIVEAHNSAKSRHTEIHAEYQKLDEMLKKAAAEITAENAAVMQAAMEMIRARMQALQEESDEVREEYAGASTFSPVRPEMPTDRGSGGSGGAASGSGDGGGGAGGDQPTGDPAAMAEKMAQSLGGESPTGGTGQSGGSPAGGGGSPSGGSGAQSGGSGAGGGTPSGLPGGGQSTPKLPTDPSLRPAAASGAGGGGAGGGAGGGGGGMPATPMSAPVTAETVAPAPTTTAAATAAPAQGGGGGATGGMGGGMAPMGHGAGAQQGKEKKRDARLAPDEDLYTEDRPWTEAVIGNRRRREAGKGGGEGADTK
ncbi:hypothetical protein SAMN04489835_1522 [Mycolicibacterium rutilum]|uniref:Uncharacterized protein n=1 Tax=Mycolicibacterium rutilum TaxID=370526 RepID=A0A1H6J442_MYCRU|nr:hypothetical protein [Mycolicibacterium rutilum]SEH56700.1 hypothetical protein SAMN04489835_1522 [Mycolicibacterium rutilum]